MLTGDASGMVCTRNPSCSGDSVPWCPRNPHWTESPQLGSLAFTNICFNSALQRHYEPKTNCILKSRLMIHIKDSHNIYS